MKFEFRIPSLFGGKKVAPQAPAAETQPAPTVTRNDAEEEAAAAEAERAALATVEYGPEGMFFVDVDRFAIRHGGEFVIADKTAVGIKLPNEETVAQYYDFLRDHPFLQGKDLAMNIEADYRKKGASDTLEIGEVRWMPTGSKGQLLVRFVPNW